MQTVIKADDGDLITIHADDLSIEQLTLRLELESPAYDGAGQFDQLTLTTRWAGAHPIRRSGRAQLAQALRGAAFQLHLAAAKERAPRRVGKAAAGCSDISSTSSARAASRTTTRDGSSPAPTARVARASSSPSTCASPPTAKAAAAIASRCAIPAGRCSSAYRCRPRPRSDARGNGYPGLDRSR